MVLCANPTCEFDIDDPLHYGTKCPVCGTETAFSRWLHVQFMVSLLLRRDHGFDDIFYWDSYYSDWEKSLAEDSGDLESNDYWPSNESTDSDFCFDWNESDDIKVTKKEHFCEQCGFCDHLTGDGHWDGVETTILPFFEGEGYEHMLYYSCSEMQ